MNNPQEIGNKENVVEACLELVKAKFQSENAECKFFHNINHTLNVLEAVGLIAQNTDEISSHQEELLKIAAIFHDVIAELKANDNETKSANYACEQLLKLNVAKEDVEIVERLIKATKLDHQPTDIMEEAIKDADIAHTGSKSYFKEPFIHLFKEINCREELSPKQWIQDCIDFFEQFPFYTKYAQEQFEPIKEQNKEKLQKLISMDINTSDELMENVTPKKKKKKKKGKDTPEKGIETLFRVNLRNHVNLSRIADDKANTLISVNAIIISIVLSTLFPKLDNNKYLMLPALSLITFSIITIIISIISTIPRTTHGVMTREDVLKKQGNLTFFGNFFRMNIKDFEWGVEELMKDKDYLYKTMSRDLYYLGVVLNKKYTFLRIGYITFVGGLVISCIVFVLGIMSNHAG